LRFLQANQTGQRVGLGGVGYDIHKRISLARINKSGVNAHSFQQGTAALRRKSRKLIQPVIDLLHDEIASKVKSTGI